MCIYIYIDIDIHLLFWREHMLKCRSCDIRCIRCTRTDQNGPQKPDGAATLRWFNAWRMASWSAEDPSAVHGLTAFLPYRNRFLPLTRFIRYLELFRPLTKFIPYRNSCVPLAEYIPYRHVYWTPFILNYIYILKYVYIVSL